jgi:alkanesulfonate monooxygenase SsuD/methylene tetrahydromethanopterin reductase-like flavin-dependent oxidoreductase (luciferase family)
VQILLKYDMRVPEGAGSPEMFYAECLDQCEWADGCGFAGVRFHEHHRSDDGYLPSPVVLASAVAGRTKTLALRCSVIVLPLHDPVRLAEDLAVLDLASGERLELVVSAGYVASEFEMFGQDIARRVELLEQGIEALRLAWTGEPFTFRGRPVKVRPRPGRQIRIAMGGSSVRAARQAARIADGFEPAPRKYLQAYLAECERLGRDPGWYPGPGHELRLLHVAEDPDATWDRIKQHARHENDSYLAWTRPAGTQVGYSAVTDADQLRAPGGYRILTPQECLRLVRELGPDAEIQLHPLMGGMDPKLGWESLELFESKVMPQLAAEGLLS